MNTSHEIAKNSQERIRFQLTEFKGKQYADLRVYYEDGDEWKPTKKGLTLSPDIWPEFVQGIEQLTQNMEDAGLLEPKEAA